MFDGVKVTIDGGLSVVGTLEFFQHDLAEMGHRETSFLCTQTRSPTSRTAGSMTRDSVRRTSDLVQVGFEEVEPRGVQNSEALSQGCWHSCWECSCVDW